MENYGFGDLPNSYFPELVKRVLRLVLPIALLAKLALLTLDLAPFARELLPLCCQFPWAVAPYVFFD